MYKITLDIDGMACGMCEAHVNEAVRKAADVKKVTSSHSKGRTEILSETELDESKLKEAIEATGYRVLSVKSEAFEKKGFSLFHKNG
ncbi:MAG: cation transporter [Lachnospiraceae bacterium]|nr:cation transporter [Lachnospiraceae bacterium]MCD8098669.1 cation transporter [Lachnospiraceae bacterium]